MHKKAHLYQLLLVLLMLIPSLLKSQQGLSEIILDDTTAGNVFYRNLNNQFILRFFALHKANVIELRKDDKALIYRPNGTVSIGVGFNYKWLGLGISLGLPSSKEQIEKYGKTQRIDLQVSIYSKAVGLDAHLQRYKGYYLANPNDYVQWNEDYFPQFPDMNVFTMGVNLFYIFNNNKFSYRAAFVGNQVQKKSAGSVVGGIFFTQDAVTTDSGFIPKEIIDTLWLDFNLKSFKASTVGLTAGYLYTFVIGQKGFFISLAGVPGIGYRKYKISDLEANTETKELIALQLLARMAIGYTRSNYFFNLTAAFNLRNYKYKSYTAGLSTEQIRFTFGLRFETKASKKLNQFYE